MAKRVSEWELVVLYWIEEKNDNTASEIIARGIPKATFYRIVKKLMEKEFVKVKHNLYSITKKGIKAIPELEKLFD